MPEEVRSLETILCEKLTEWLRRSAPRVTDDTEAAAITIEIMNPGAEPDGTVYLEARVTETTHVDDLGGTVPGLQLP